MRIRPLLSLCTLALLSVACTTPSSTDASSTSDSETANATESSTMTSAEAGSADTTGDGDGDGDGDGEPGDGDGDGDGDGGIECGNMVIEAGEDCDDGNQVDTDACTNVCASAACGDAIVHEGAEECDDGNADPFDMCTNECLLPVCGDGVVQGLEQCDAGPDNGPGLACKGDCTTNVCGDADIGPGESCDDGNQVDDDLCNNACVLTSCGDGITQMGEDCDDANVDNTDACTNACTAASCGDEFVQMGEECDLGGANSPNGDCTTDCGFAVCGDGFIWAGQEECDDGLDNGPGQSCKGDCTANFCGDEDVGPGEQCDNGEVNNGPGLECTSNCQNNICGDGDPGPNEGCDDGNLIGGDGCSPMCAIENPPPMAIPCGNAIYECGDALDNDNDGFVDLDDPDCTTPCDDKENSLQTDLPGQNNDCKADCFWDANSGQGDDHCVWNLKCDPENPGADVGCAYDPNFAQCELMMPQACLDFCVPLVPNGCDCFGCCQIAGEFIYLDSNPQCSMDNLDACNNCTFFDNCNNPCEQVECELCFGQSEEDLPPECEEPSCDFGTPCSDQSECMDGDFCQTGCCVPIVPG
jgi:cysteine-rich repeat protein